MLSDYQVMQCPRLCSQVEAVVCLDSIEGIYLGSFKHLHRTENAQFQLFWVDQPVDRTAPMKMLHEVDHSEDSQSHCSFLI